MRELYERAARVLERVGFSAYIPHLATDPLRHPNVTPAQVYATDRQQVAGADLVVVFLDRPSFGVGQELEIAGNALVPLLLVVREGAAVSRMALGGPARQYGPLRYSTWEDLEPQLSAAATQIASELAQRVRSELPNIGAALHRARTRAGMARAELAQRVGVSVEFITLVETGDPRTSNPTVAFLGAATRALDLSIADLLGVGPTVTTPLRTSLQAFAVRERLSFGEYAELEALAARGLRSDRALSVDEWQSIRRARMSNVRPVEQLELPSDGRD